jgi:hypothetical protein
MNKLTLCAILLLIASLLAFFWGLNYQQSHQFSGIANLFGDADPTYKVAGQVMIAGVIGFFVGIACLIGGLVQGRKAS